MMCEPRAPWADLLPAGAPWHGGTLQTDALVIGGGWPGLIAATELAERGASVVLLEARPVLAGGTSGVAPGLAAAGLVEHPWRLVSSIGEDDARALYELSAAGRALLPGTVSDGVAWLAVNAAEEAEISRSVEVLSRWGVAVEAWNSDQTCRTLGANRLGAGWFVGADKVVDPAGVTRSLAERALRAGVRIHTDALVTRVGNGSKGLIVQVARERTVHCEVAVLAAEAGLPQLDPWFSEVLSPTREQAIFLPGRSTPHAFRSGYGYTQWVPVTGGLVVSGCRFASAHMEVGETDATQTTPAIQAKLEASVAQFFEPARVAARWSWITTRSCDGLPLVGPMPGNPRVVVCAGFDGLESTLGVRCGLAAAEGLLTGVDGLPRRLAPMRFV